MPRRGGRPVNTEFSPSHGRYPIPAQRGGVTDLVKVVPRVAATFIKVASPVWADRIHPPSGSEVRLRNQAVETLIMAELQARSANEIGWSGGHQLSLARPKSVG